MTYYSFGGRLLCSHCGRKMQMTVATLDEDRGNVIEFGCTNCSTTVALPLNLGLTGDGGAVPPDYSGA